MKLKIVFILTFCAFLQVLGQKCDCLKNINLLQQKIEDNQASFQHQVIEQKRKDEYYLHKSEINTKAKNIENKKDCIALLALYLSFFRDEHSFFSYNENFNPLPNPIIRSNNNKDIGSIPFIGEWYFSDGSFSITIFPSKTTFGEWVAVIKDDNSKSWKKGELKIEFFKNTKGSYNCIYWRKNRIPKSLAVIYSDSTLCIGRDLIFYRKKQVLKKNSNDSNGLHFESISDNSSYLRIPSFDLSFKNQIDSLLVHHKKEISQKKNLIIDIRNNSGGGFEAFQALLPYVLDNNLTETPYYGSVWVSKDNFAYYDSTKYEYTENKQDSINELEYVEFLKRYLGHFTPVEIKIDSIELIQNNPVKIGIIFNRNTGSSAEGFILQASNSKKVTTFGENSMGAVSYGDWMPFELPELNIWVAITTKKMVFKNNSDFESFGISPDVDLTSTNENEWLKIVLEKLEK